MACTPGFTRPDGPSQSTVQRIFKGLDCALLESRLGQWAARVIAACATTHRQDREAVAAAERVLRWLKKSATGPERLRLVYVDEREVHTHSHLAKVWRRRGHPMRIPAADADRKMAVFGAVDYATGRVIWRASERKGEQAFAGFLDHLAATLPADVPTVLVLDNVGYHKSRALRAHWQRLSGRFQPFWLPAYSPRLNLMGRIWRFLKDNLSCHRWWNDPDRLQEASETLLSQLTVHFHTEDRPAFRLRQDFCYSA